MMMLSRFLAHQVGGLVRELGTVPYWRRLMVVGNWPLGPEEPYAKQRQSPGVNIAGLVRGSRRWAQKSALVMRTRSTALDRNRVTRTAKPLWLCPFSWMSFRHEFGSRLGRVRVKNIDVNLCHDARVLGGSGR
jgi:hypothetical protein